MKLYYFYTLKALWDGKGKIKMYHGMSRIKKRENGLLLFIKYSKLFRRVIVDICSYKRGFRNSYFLSKVLLHQSS